MHKLRLLIAGVFLLAIAPAAPAQTTDELSETLLDRLNAYLTIAHMCRPALPNAVTDARSFGIVSLVAFGAPAHEAQALLGRMDEVTAQAVAEWLDDGGRIGVDPVEELRICTEMVEDKRFAAETAAAQLTAHLLATP